MVTRFVLGLPIRRRDDDDRFSDPGFLADAVRAADERGFWGMTAPDHIVSPNAWAQAGGGEMWHDPFVLLSYAAALTTRLRLVTHIIVLPYRGPFPVAKALASLDRLSGGRAVLGVGSGYLEEEFDILGVPFHERGARTDEGLRAIIACWTEEEPRFEGRFYRITDARMGPRPLQQPRPPIWIGGNSMRAVRRAVDLGDCWAPFDPRPELVREGAARAETLGRRIDIAAPLGRVQKEGATRPHTVAGDDVAPRIGELLDAGAGYVKLSCGGRTPEEWSANLEWFAAEIMPRFS